MVEPLYYEDTEEIEPFYSVFLVFTNEHFLKLLLEMTYPGVEPVAGTLTLASLLLASITAPKALGRSGVTPVATCGMFTNQIPVPYAYRTYIPNL